MEFTTRLELQSQTTRLVEDLSYGFSAGMNGALTLLGTTFAVDFARLVS